MIVLYVYRISFYAYFILWSSHELHPGICTLHSYLKILAAKLSLYS